MVVLICLVCMSPCSWAAFASCCATSIEPEVSTTGANEQMELRRTAGGRQWVRRVSHCELLAGIQRNLHMHVVCIHMMCDTQRTCWTGIAFYMYVHMDPHDVKILLVRVGGHAEFSRSYPKYALIHALAMRVFTCKSKCSNHLYT